MAIVAGAPITAAQFHRWELVAAKTQAAESPGQPVIVPDPPGFTKCIAAVRKSNPGFAHRPTAALRSVCAQLFKTLANETLQFLIAADWYHEDAARRHLLPSAAQINRSLDENKRKQFPNDAQYQAFLRQTGQTDADIRYRFALQLTVSALTAHQAGGAAALDREVRRLFLPKTLCAPQYVMSDCSNYRGAAP